MGPQINSLLGNLPAILPQRPQQGGGNATALLLNILDMRRRQDETALQAEIAKAERLSREQIASQQAAVQTRGQDLDAAATLAGQDLKREELAGIDKRFDEELKFKREEFAANKGFKEKELGFLEKDFDLKSKQHDLDEKKFAETQRQWDDQLIQNELNRFIEYDKIDADTARQDSINKLQKYISENEISERRSDRLLRSFEFGADTYLKNKQLSQERELAEQQQGLDSLRIAGEIFSNLGSEAGSSLINQSGLFTGGTSDNPLSLGGFTEKSLPDDREGLLEVIRSGSKNDIRAAQSKLSLIEDDSAKAERQQEIYKKDVDSRREDYESSVEAFNESKDLESFNSMTRMRSRLEELEPLSEQEKRSFIRNQTQARGIASKNLDNFKLEGSVDEQISSFSTVLRQASETGLDNKRIENFRRKFDYKILDGIKDPKNFDKPIGIGGIKERLPKLRTFNESLPDDLAYIPKVEQDSVYSRGRELRVYHIKGWYPTTKDEAERQLQTLETNPEYYLRN